MGMSKDEVIKGIIHHKLKEKSMQELNHDECFDCPYRPDGKCMCESIEPLLDDALALLKEHGWIPVTERLPRSIANKVLVYVQHEDYVGYIGYGHYEKYKGQEMWFDLEHNEEFSKRGYHVTHWMETPMPPMEGR